MIGSSWMSGRLFMFIARYPGIAQLVERLPMFRIGSAVFNRQIVPMPAARADLLDSLQMGAALIEGLLDGAKSPHLKKGAAVRL